VHSDVHRQTHTNTPVHTHTHTHRELHTLSVASVRVTNLELRINCISYVAFHKQICILAYWQNKYCNSEYATPTHPCHAVFTSFTFIKVDKIVYPVTAVFASASAESLSTSFIMRQHSKVHNTYCMSFPLNSIGIKKKKEKKLRRH